MENDQKKLDNANAVEMRNRAPESLGRTQKRQRNEDKENAKRKQKSRRTGGDTIANLGGKNVLVQKWKEEELQLQKPRVEVEGKREDQSRKQQQDMMKILLKQTKQATRADAKLSADVYLNATAAVSDNYEASRKKK